MPRIDRDTSPIDSIEFDPPRRFPTDSTVTKSDSSLSSLSRTPSPPPSHTHAFQQPPRRQPVPAIRRPQPTSIPNSPEVDPKRTRAGSPPPKHKVPRVNCYAPSPPYFPPALYFSRPSSPVIYPAIPARVSRRNQPKRFWTLGQENWHTAPLDIPLMNPGEYGVWENTKKGEPCQTYTMYISSFKRKARGLVSAPFRKMPNGKEVPMRVLVEESTANRTTTANRIEDNKNGMGNIEHGTGEVEANNSEHTTTEAEEGELVEIAKAAEAIKRISSPTTQPAETKTPGSGRRSRPRRGGSYSLVMDSNRKKRNLSDGPDPERADADRVKRRSVGLDEDDGSGEETKTAFKLSDGPGDRVDGVKPTSRGIDVD